MRRIAIQEQLEGKAVDWLELLDIIRSMVDTSAPYRRVNAPIHVLSASVVGTTIEYFDFYIYGTAAVLVFPRLFFPTSDPSSAGVASLATFGVAFFARPLGSVLFGHFGDRIGRKATLVGALLTMGLSTVIIGLLPTYDTIGIAAPVVLAACRFGQGLGLGGEWGGATLVAVENAPPADRALYGMFPQLGAPFGLLLSGCVFLALSAWMSDRQFIAYGWRLPFVASAVLVGLGFYVRSKIVESPAFCEALERRETVRFPMRLLLLHHSRSLLYGVLLALSGFVAFYIMTVFALSWATTRLGFTREEFLLIQLLGSCCFAATIAASAIASGRGRRWLLIVANVAMIAFGLIWPPLLAAGRLPATLTMCLGMSLIGLVFGPLGTALSDLFPTAVRYSGTSLAFSGAGILGASLSPYAATFLATRFGLESVGYYLSAAACLSMAAVAGRK